MIHLGALVLFQVLAATQTPGEAGKSWFQGTADAVRQFHWLFEVLSYFISRIVYHFLYTGYVV